MSCVCILAPVVVAAWPSFSTAVLAAAAAMGYAAVPDQTGKRTAASSKHSVSLEIERSEIVTQHLGRDQRIAVTRDGVTVTFARDARGRATLCVTGEGYSDEALREMGQELSQRVVQTYVYQRLMDEMRSRQYHVVEEETAADNSIRLKVRHWEN